LCIYRIRLSPFLKQYAVISVVPGTMPRFGFVYLLQLGSSHPAGIIRRHFYGEKEIMSKLNRFGWMAAALLVSFASYAAGNAGDIEISGTWTRATAPGQDAAGVDMTITSKQAATLVGVSSPVAGSAELHSMTSEGGMMRMREVKSIELPAGKHVNLRESGYHLMLNGLKAPLKAGDSIPLTLEIKVSKRSVKIETKAEVRPLTTTSPATEQDHSISY
jgi:copper(I)-binding protein